MSAEPASAPSKTTHNGQADFNRPAERIPPQDLEAEMSLLGSMMLHRDAIGDVLPLIHRDEADRLYRPDHRKISKYGRFRRANIRKKTAKTSIRRGIPVERPVVPEDVVIKHRRV